MYFCQGLSKEELGRDLESEIRHKPYFIVSFVRVTETTP